MWKVRVFPIILIWFLSLMQNNVTYLNNTRVLNMGGSNEFMHVDVLSSSFNDIYT